MRLDAEDLAMPDDKPTAPPAPKAEPTPAAPAPAASAAPAPQPAPELSAEELDQLAGAGPRQAHFS